MARKKLRKKVRRLRTVITRFVMRRIQLVIGKYRFWLIPVQVFHHGSRPKTIRCTVGDVVQFINASGKPQVRIKFSASPFVAGNPPETIIVRSIPVLRVVVGPLGQYDSESEAAGGTQGPPDGPSVIVE